MAGFLVLVTALCGWAKMSGST